MATDEATKESQSPEQPSGKRSMKVVLITAVLMVVEAAAVFAFLTITSAPPEAATADQIAGMDADDAERLVEIEILTDKFQNLSQGRVWIWDMQVFVKVRHKSEEKAKELLERNAAEIRAGIGGIVRRAPHSYLTEPGLESITHQVTHFLEQALGTGPEGEPRVERVLIPKCRGYPADF